jgi:hypothetical protein
MEKLKILLESYRAGDRTLEDVLRFLKKLPYEDLSFARIDHHRHLRRGFPEVVFGEGKSAEQIARILEAMLPWDDPVLVTRVDPQKARKVIESHAGLTYEASARALFFQPKSQPLEDSNESPRGIVQVLCAGSSDIHVAEEAALTAQLMGSQVQRFYDVGVAGLHRLLHLWDELQNGAVYVVVAGMEGALPSVVAGLVARPVIAVPTSVGYGASFGGLSALLGMLNSCAPGVAVVNIDNGFGAGYLAAMIAES